MYNTDSDSLNAGAPDIRLSGNQQMASDPNPEAEWRNLYDNYKHESIQQGKEYIEFEDFIDMYRDLGRAPRQNSGIMASAPGTYTQNRKRQMAAGGGVADLKNIQGQNHMLAYITPGEANSLQNMGGQKVMTPEGIPAYPPQESRAANFGGQEQSGGGGGNGRSQALQQQSYSNPVAQAVVNEAINQAIANEALNTPADDDIDALYSASGADFTPTDTRTTLDKARDLYQTVSPLGIATNLLKKPVNQYEGITGEDIYDTPSQYAQDVLNIDYESLDNEGQAEIDKQYLDAGYISDSASDMGYSPSQIQSTDSTTTSPTTTSPTTTEDEIMTLAEADTGLTPAEAQEVFQKNVAEQKAANLAAKADVPFKDYYVGGKPTADQLAFMKAAGASPRTLGLEQFAARGGRIGYDQGGIAGIRQPYGLGDIVKKITGGAKKIFKSPIGKAALLGAGIFGVPGTQFTGLMGSKFLTGALAKGTHHADPGWLKAALGKVMTKKGLGTAATLATLSPFLMKQEEDDDEKLAAMYRGKSLDIPGIRTAVGKKNLRREDYPFMPSSYYAAEGGRIGLAEGLSPRQAALRAMYNLNDDDEEKTKYAASGGRIGYRDGIGPNQGSPGIMSQAITDTEVEDAYGISVGDEVLQRHIKEIAEQSASPEDFPATDSDFQALEVLSEQTDVALQEIIQVAKSLNFTTPEQSKGEMYSKYMAQGGRVPAQEGGLMNLGGMEKDYRAEGGFVPIGGKEKADDVPARLSKNEFVFTADAVRNAGGGDIDKGAEIMENLMNSLESGGEVSEESQGLEGARGMFANAQQLEKRII